MHAPRFVIGIAPFALIHILLTGLAHADGPCEFPTKPPPALTVRDGFVEFIAPEELGPLKDALPPVADAHVQAILSSPDTMWYDEKSMVFAYQDSIETVVGGRANCVGRRVGETNASNPGIFKLTNYFGPDYRFKFPFRMAAGTDNVDNARVINFWSPPRAHGKAKPVKYWRPTTRGHWYWTFPVGTTFGEVLYEKGPDNRWYAFEIRTRKRYRDGWEVDLFRPFVTAESLARAVIEKKPDWQSHGALRRFVTHLRDKNTLVAHRLESPAFGKVFPPIDGSLDILPAPGDERLIAELLSTTPFVSAEGAIWKENGRLETYAPSSGSDFSVVPRGYEMGMYPVNEVSCNRCHSETSRRLSTFEFDIILYGELWGEDRIFTWHPFEPNRYIYATWDDADVPSRKANPKLLTAGLLLKEKPTAADPDYKPLPNVFVPDENRNHRKGNY